MAGSLTSLGWAQGFSSLLSAYGSLEAGRIARIEGERKRVFAQFEAEEARRLAGREIAASQRAAAEERRQADLVASRALAVAAASGAGVSDPTVLRLIAQAKGERAYRASLALYEGEVRAHELESQAVGSGIRGRSESLRGRVLETAYRGRAVGELTRTAGSLYARYGEPAGSGDAALIGTYEHGHT